MSFVRGETQFRKSLSFIGLGAADVENPANWSRVKTQKIILDAYGKVRVVVRRIGSQQLFCDRARTLGVAESEKILLLDHRGVIATQAVDHDQRKQRMQVVRIVGQALIR